MSRHLRTACRLDLVIVALLCFAMAGCIAGLRRQPKPDTQRVAYLGIAEATPQLEQAVSKRVDPGYERVSAEEYREAARKLQAETMTDLDVARVARALDVDVIIHGRYVRKNRRRGHVAVLMRTAATGAVVSEYIIPVRRGTMTRRGERKLDSELRAELEALLGPPVPVPAEPAEAVASAEPAPDQAAGAPRNVNDKADEKKAARAQAAAPAQAAPTPAPARAGAARAQAAATPVAAQAAPAPARAAKASDKRASRVSEKTAAGNGAVVRNQPAAPAPVIRQDASGQVIDDEQPPGL